MPHVVLDKKIDLNKFNDSFDGLYCANPIIKIQNIFLDKQKRTVLLPTVVIESNDKQHFLIEINVKDKSTTIRLYPNTDPKKTAGVKTSMGLLCEKILYLFDNVKIEKTNIGGFLGKLQ